VGRNDPLQELLNLQERINRLFEENLGRGRGEDGESAFGSRTWTPLADVYETSEGFVVLLELAGLDRGDVEIAIAERTVTVKGERCASNQARPDSFHRMERRYGSFARTFRFTEPIDSARVEADLSDGLLKLELPKLHPSGGWRSRAERNG
jgi:HSP20 family protein